MPDIDWTTGLKQIGFDDLRPFYDAPDGPHRNAVVELNESRKLVRRPTARRMIDATRTANALKLLGRLPAAGETWHLISKGNTPLADLIPAVLELAFPATIRYLGITTLGFSKINVEALCTLIDAKRVRRLDFVFSSYFRGMEKDVCAFIITELTGRGARVLAARCHAKLMLFELTDGRCLVCETSGNLRSCRSIEQITLTNDRRLLAFHRAWIDELFRKHEEAAR